MREAENLLSLEANQEKKAGTKSKKQLEQLKRDVVAISDAIATYKEQIAKLEGKNKTQSAEFKKLIANLNAELDQRNKRLQRSRRNWQIKTSCWWLRTKKSIL